jgi:biotin carboxylase
MKKKLAILGASEYVNPLIEKAKIMDIETHVFAWSADEIGEQTADVFHKISIRNKEDILASCKELGIDGILTLGSDQGALTASWVAENLGLVGNPYIAVYIAVNKLLTRTRFEETGIPQPRFVGIGDSVSASDCRGMPFPVVVKPTDRSASRGVKKVWERNELLRSIALARDLSFERKAIVEEYITGRHYSCECFSDSGRHDIIITVRRNNFEDRYSFLEHLHSAPAELTVSQHDRIKELIPKTLDAIGLQTGATSVEFVIDLEDNIKIIEVTPCLYGDFIATDLVDMVSNIDYMQMAIQSSLRDNIIHKLASTNLKRAVNIILSKDDLQQKMKANENNLVLKERLFVKEELIPDAVDGGRYGYFIQNCDVRQNGNHVK